jgi:hypothetical protein
LANITRFVRASVIDYYDLNIVVASRSIFEACSYCPRSLMSHNFALDHLERIERRIFIGKTLAAMYAIFSSALDDIVAKLR